MQFQVFRMFRVHAIDSANTLPIISNVMKTLQIRIPDQLRADADAVLADIGLDLPTADRLYLTKIVQTRSIPFSLEAPSVPIEQLPVDAETQAQMDAIATEWNRRPA